MRRGAHKIKDVETRKLQKPEEPDFSAEPDDDDQLVGHCECIVSHINYCVCSAASISCTAAGKTSKTIEAAMKPHDGNTNFKLSMQQGWSKVSLDIVSVKIWKI